MTPTIGLALICGPQDGEELMHLLASVNQRAERVWDHVHVTIAAPEPCPKIAAAAESTGATTSYFRWCDDFGAARNFAFDKLHELHDPTWVSWLDSDDVITPDAYTELLALRAELLAPDFPLDVVFLPYRYSGEIILPRERFIRAAVCPRWDGCGGGMIHEMLPVWNGNLRVDKRDTVIVHNHVKPYTVSLNRNIRILQKAFELNPQDPRTRYYYARDFAQSQNAEERAEGAKLMAAHVRLGEGNKDELAVACVKLAEDAFKAVDIQQARTWALLGLGWGDAYAELWTFAGYCHECIGDLEQARSHYLRALDCKYGSAGFVQLRQFYHYAPLERLAVTCAGLREWDRAQSYLDRALAERDSAGLDTSKTRAELDQVTALIAYGSKHRTIDAGTQAWLRRQLRKISMSYAVLNNCSEYADVRVFAKRELSVWWAGADLPEDNGPARIRRHNVVQALTKTITFVDHDDATVLVYPTGTWPLAEQIRRYQVCGQKVILDCCEDCFTNENLRSLYQADRVTVCSAGLGKRLGELGVEHVGIIYDAAEYIDDGSAGHGSAGHGSAGDEGSEATPGPCHVPTALYLGYGGNQYLAEQLRPVAERAGWQLQICSEWSSADIPWTADGWKQVLAGCDVVVLPCRPTQPHKSANRLTQAISQGVPVIATRLPAYLEAAKDGDGVLYADSPAEWSAAFGALATPEARQGLAVKGHLDARYTPSGVALQWSAALRDALTAPVKQHSTKTPPAQPDPVDIIVPVYNQLSWLRECVWSIWSNTTHPYRLILSDAGSGPETWAWLRSIRGPTVLGAEGVRRNFAEAVNAGIRGGTSKYVVLLNSDCVVGPGWLDAMVKRMASTTRLAACNPLSNCDQSWRHNEPMILSDGLELHPGMSWDETDMPNRRALLYDYLAHAGREKFHAVDWVAYYCTILARSAVNEVGLLDPAFVNGCEDRDHQERLTRAEYKSGHTWDAVVFHAGGASRGGYQGEARAQYDAQDDANHVLLGQRWAKQSVAIWTGPALETWGRADVLNGMAGSETWAMMLAEEFARRDWRVTLYGNTGRPAYEECGVKWVDHADMLDDQAFGWHDHVIASRWTQPFTQPLHCRGRWVQVHDVWIMPGAQTDVMPWQIDGYAVFSDWHRDTILSTHPSIPRDKVFLTHNGVDQSLYDGHDSVDKRNWCVYSSSPDRGLLQLLGMVPAIRAAVPDFELHVCYGFFNWEHQRNGEADKAFIARIKAAMEQPGVAYHDRVSKLTLANLQMQAKVWLYPTWFWETFCVSAVENGLAGNALLCTNLAGLKSTVGSAGVLMPADDVDGKRLDDYPQPWVDRFVDNAVALLRDDPTEATRWGDVARQKMLTYSWGKAVDGWIERFERKG